MISNTGVFLNLKGKLEDNHPHDRGLSNGLCQLASQLGVRKLYDFGCGAGVYVRDFRRIGIDATGIDGNPETRTVPNCRVQDLTCDFKMDPVDFLVCLEVAEHMPKEFEKTLLSRIDDHLNRNGILVLSWAIVGQPGFGHVNCQNNDYVINTLKDIGYSLMNTETNMLREASTDCFWFKNTILVFKKN